MKLLRAWPVLLAFVALLGGFCWLISVSESFRGCVKTERAANISRAAHRPPEKVIPSFEIYGGCAGGFLESTEGEGLLTALATILIAIFTGTLYVATTEQGRLTEIAIQDARIASQRELRAYVSVLPKTAFLARGDTFAVVVHTENTGNTPAFNTVCNWQLDVGEVPGAQEFSFNFVNPENKPIPTFVLYPKGVNTSVKEYQITQEDMKKLKAGTHAIRAFGSVRYFDAFSEEQVGEFFCYMDVDGYKLWLGNYLAQQEDERRPVTAPFKFTQFNNRASFS